jgi:RimJ/RimL family protein N-acetyltransferase
MQTASAGETGVLLETERLGIRSLRDDDLPELVALIGNWEVVRWVSSVPHPQIEADGWEWIARVQQDDLTGRPRRFAIALKDNDPLIGDVGIDGSTGDESEEPALGYWLGEPHWGNGYAREAVAAIIDYGLQTLGMETTRAYTDPSNVASQKVLLHCGLKNVGEIELVKPTRHGALRAPLFCISKHQSDHKTDNVAPRIGTELGNHSFRATGIGVSQERRHARKGGGNGDHASPRTTHSTIAAATS